MRNYVIDIPRTIFSLKLSRCLGRLREVRSLEGLLDHNMEHVLIECFFENLKRLILADPTIKGIGFHVGRVDELEEIIRTGKSRTFQPAQLN